MVVYLVILLLAGLQFTNFSPNNYTGNRLDSAPDLSLYKYGIENQNNHIIDSTSQIGNVDNGEGLNDKKKRKEIKEVATQKKDVLICPVEPEGLDFSAGFPQNLTFGRFRKEGMSDLERGRPYITQDCWVDAVDNKRTFFMRPLEGGMPSTDDLQRWIQSRPHPITLVLNNQVDKSWPLDLKNKTDYERILNEPNLHAVYSSNARFLEEYPKLRPIPIGLKWNYRSTKLFSESKPDLTTRFLNYSSSTPEQVEALFRSDHRMPTLYYRHMINSNKRTKNYVRDTPALQTIRHAIFPIINTTAKESLRMSGKLDVQGFFSELKKHRFIISPPGNGLDTHATWEALLTGCIPIVPKSALDGVFEDLPVWLVESWDEVTDKAVKEKIEEFTAPEKKYKWEKLFFHYWEEQIHEGLCQIENSYGSAGS